MNKLKIVIIVVVSLQMLGAATYFFAVPLTEDGRIKNEAAGTSLLKLHEQYPDVIGWIQVEGTNINYPVAKGETYLYQNYKGKHDKSGTPFVEDEWTEGDRMTLIYAHNMWMYKTMFNGLHEFKKEAFFQEGKKIAFYVVCDTEDDSFVEKRLFRASHCILTDISEWNFDAGQYVCEDEELEEFLAECDRRSLFGTDAEAESQYNIMLATCSYHIGGKNGRIVVVGKLISIKQQNYIDKDY